MMIRVSWVYRQCGVSHLNTRYQVYMEELVLELVTSSISAGYHRVLEHSRNILPSSGIPEKWRMLIVFSVES